MATIRPTFLRLAAGRLSGSTGQYVLRSQRIRFNSSTSSSSSATSPKKKNNAILYTGLVTLAGAGYYYYSKKSTSAAVEAKPFVPTYEDYKKVYNAVADKFEADDYDDGSYAPVVLRLAWHSSGTYDKETNTGGSSGATMRFSPESGHGANNGLDIPRKLLETVHDQFPWISHGDLWTLAGVAAVQELGGPTIKWRPGRVDLLAGISTTPDGRLPDGSKGADHLRNIFYRMGFNDQEIVALTGAHALGRCHVNRSGFDGPWTFAPTYLTNDFYKLLLDEKWHYRKWDGPKQWEDNKTKSLMMLPADFSLVQDKQFKKYVEKYAKDQDLFFEDFSKVITKLFELGVVFKPNQEYWTFPATNA
ncbi:heme peroxidase [Lipomyces japonicus]|uniref:heme peroxidase n=1 Tax=Lipomyces japonicus TaxID=56871 RepID=UPI0034D0147E